MVCFYSLDGIIVDELGSAANFWLTGTTVYAVVVIVVSLKILHLTNTHSFMSQFWFWGSLLSFWGALWLENLFKFFPDVY